MTSLKELIAQKEALEKQIEQTRQTDRTEAISQIKTLMHEYGLSTADLSARKVGTVKARANAGSKVPAKFSDTATGDTWSGRGLKPKWLTAAIARGRTLQEFAV